MPGEPGLLLATEISRQNVAKEGWTTYYVSKDGNDGANGLKWESAFLTIQRAIDVAESWAKIYIKAGTYNEEVVISKQGIHLIGEKRNTVIIHPDAGYCLDIYGESCTIETLKCFNPTGGVYGVLVSGVGERAKFVNIEFDGVAGSYGILLWTDFIEICDCYMSNANMKIGIDMGAGFCKCYNNYIKLTRGDSTGIVLSEDSTTIYSNRVFENTIEGCHRGIEALGISKYASIYHNNLINNTIQIEDFGTENHFFENFYDNHTVDTNNDGLCDTPYTFTGGVDYSPVSKRNGWNQISIGFQAGGGAEYQGDIEIWDSFEYGDNDALRAVWKEGGFAGNPTLSGTFYEGQYSMQTVIGAGGVGHIYRLLAARNMKPLINIGIASQSSVGGDTFQFTLYDSAGRYSYWTQTCNATPNTWSYHNINPHSAPTNFGPGATSVDLEDIVEIRMANLTAGSTYKFDFIKLMLQTEKIEVNEVVIYPVSEHAGTTEITDDGTSPAYYADTECGDYPLETDPNVHWLEDINFENAGTITVISMFLYFEWHHKTSGGTAYSKIQVSGDGGNTWVDVTDSIVETNAAYQSKIRSGVGNFVATITPGANQLQFRLVSWVSLINTSCAKIRSSSYIRLTYRKS